MIYLAATPVLHNYVEGTGYVFVARHAHKYFAFAIYIFAHVRENNEYLRWWSHCVLYQ